MHNSDLDEARKLRELQSACVGEARDLLKRCNQGSESYARAWELLCRECEDSYKAVQVHLKRFMDMRPMSPTTIDHEGLLVIVNTAREIYRQLSEMGRKIEHWDDFLIYVITSKLSKVVLADWEQIRRSDMDKGTEQTYHSLMTFLERYSKTNSSEHGSSSELS